MSTLSREGKMGEVVETVYTVNTVSYEVHLRA